jgi:hypothetical protein
MPSEDNELDTPYSLLNAYQNLGMVGYIDSPRDRGMFSESQERPVYSEPNMSGSGQGQRAALWAYAQALDKGAYTEKQGEPDCTSHASRNARDTSRCVQILVKGEAKSFSARGATEPTYGARGHGGAGMSPARAAMFENKNGFLIRQKYPPVDLSVYRGEIGASWGRAGGVPKEVVDLCSSNKVGIIRQIRTINDAVDALFNGYALMSGQYAAWSASPSKDHIHTRISPGWSHAMATVGMDFTRKFWPFDVFFIVNSWGPWNQKPKEWPSDLPPWVPGMIVTRAEDWSVCVESEDCYAYGSVDGFPPQRLPDFGTIGMLHHGE